MVTSVMPWSHHRWYVLQLQVYWGCRAASTAASYLPRFSVAFTLWQVSFAVIVIGWNAPVIQLPSEVCMRPCDTMVKCPFTSTRLMSAYYTESSPSHNLIYTVDHTFSYCSKKKISVHVRIHLRMPIVVWTINRYAVFRSFLAYISKFTKSIWEPVIQNFIILGHLMANTSSRRQKNTCFLKYVTFLLYTEQKSCLHTL